MVSDEDCSEEVDDASAVEEVAEEEGGEAWVVVELGLGEDVEVAVL